jgi:transposase
MPKGPKGKSPPSKYESRDRWQAKPQRKRLNAAERRARKAAAMRFFAKQYGRRAHAGFDPNDRKYDREIEKAVRRMKPEELDKLLREGDDVA